MILWTDGGARPTNPGPSGWGIHGYLFNAVQPKKGNGQPDYAITNFGYVLKPDWQKAALPAVTEATWATVLEGSTKVFEITPVHYVDAHGSFAGHETNNVAELVAALRALEYAHDYDIQLLRIHLDSKYVLDGITEWVKGWERNNWLTRDGEPVKNVQHWRALVEAKTRLEVRGVKIVWHKVKGHADDFGNQLADRYASVGCIKARERLLAGETSSHQDITSTPSEGYWKYESNKHPFIAHRRVYFNTLPEYVEPGLYYIGEHGKDDELLGKRMSDGAFAVVKLGTPCPALEMVRNRQTELADGANTIVMGRLDQLYHAETHKDLSRFGINSLERPKSYNLDIKTLTDKPLTHELKPARLAHRVATAVDDLISWRDAYLAKASEISVTDLTDILYERTTKAQKAGKDGVVPEPIVEMVLKSDYNSGFAKLPVEATYVSPDGIRAASVTLVLGMDLPDRNALKRMEGYCPTISLITWMESPAVFRYATVIETEHDIGIYCGYYSNTVLVPAGLPNKP